MSFRFLAYLLLSLTPVLWALCVFALDFFANELGMNRSREP